MAAISVFTDFPSPSSPSSCSTTSSPSSYVYPDAELSLDCTSISTMTSPMECPMESPYDLTFPQAYPSPEATTTASASGDAGPSEEQSQTPSKPAAKRKRENRYKNAPPSVLSRRRAQNRASQRAYRERKDQRIKDLEVLLGEAQHKNEVISQAYATLQAEYLKLRAEQDAASTYQQPGLMYDPTISVTAADMDIFLYGDPIAAYTG
ncbi:hypothetical protein GGR56DRAFT_569641 [Xylariaceae sp. FL0804]|nr:hypothetical protein GGR56DRAFT_569641 [Xylariaceae sp. FL0804]